MKLQLPKKEILLLLIPVGLLQKAESVNMILEYADKKEKGLVDKVL
jgi:hypothetical protein